MAETPRATFDDELELEDSPQAKGPSFPVWARYLTAFAVMTLAIGLAVALWPGALAFIAGVSLTLPVVGTLSLGFLAPLGTTGALAMAAGAATTGALISGLLTATAGLAHAVFDGAMAVGRALFGSNKPSSTPHAAPAHVTEEGDSASPRVAGHGAALSALGRPVASSAAVVPPKPADAPKSAADSPKPDADAANHASTESTTPTAPSM